MFGHNSGFQVTDTNEDVRAILIRPPLLPQIASVAGEAVDGGTCTPAESARVCVCVYARSAGLTLLSLSLSSCRALIPFSHSSFFLCLSPVFISSIYPLLPVQKTLFFFKTALRKIEKKRQTTKN